MDYEKKYHEVLERAQQALKDGTITNSAIAYIQDIFPELKEESEDERIRKYLTDYVKRAGVGHSLFDSVNTRENILSWLEKQDKQKSLDDIAKEITKNKETAISFLKSCGIMNANGELADEYKIERGEQKPADMAEPKFKAGDWIIDKQGLIHQISNVVENVTTNTFGYDIVGGGYFNEKCDVRLWTIQDAKDGDVLADIYGNIGIYEKHYDFDWVSYFSLGCNGGFQCFEVEHENEKTYPATKAQRDTLFAKMKEAGYEWDAEKKELKMINTYCQENCKGYQETGRCFVDGECEAKKLAGTAWSEEDEKHVNSLLKRLEGLVRNEFAATKFAINEDEDWLKSLKDRVQPKQEWSEEDEKMLNGLIFVCDVWSTKYSFISTEYEDVEQMKDWLKSLKPQKHWKPSNEQMYMLEWLTINVLDDGVVGNHAKEVLNTLIEQLKQL